MGLGRGNGYAVYFSGQRAPTASESASSLRSTDGIDQQDLTAASHFAFNLYEGFFVYFTAKKEISRLS